MAARPGCLVSGRSAGFGSGAPGPPVCRCHVRMAFRRHFEKPQSTLVLDGGLRQPGESETILPTQEEDEPMSGKRHLRGRERSSARPADCTTGLSFYPLTPDRWDDFEVLFGPRGACAGCWCMWWRLTSHEFREGAGTVNRDRFRECVRELTPPGVLAYRDQAAVGWCAVAPREKYRRLASFGRRFPAVRTTSTERKRRRPLGGAHFRDSDRRFFFC
jgi:hypothetical protein